MPYIEPAQRFNCNPMIGDSDFARAENPGQLNYQITMLIAEYWTRTGNYQGINDIVGALEGAKLEFYRRIAVPYEDEKIKANSDVYPE